MEKPADIDTLLLLIQRLTMRIIVLEARVADLTALADMPAAATIRGPR